MDGQRFRLSLETTDWRVAQAKQKELIGDAREGRLESLSTEFSRLSFGDAAERYLQSRKLELAPSSLKKEKQLLVQPRTFFDMEPIARISAEGLMGFREWRAKSGVGPAIINMEMGVLRRS